MFDVTAAFMLVEHGSAAIAEPPQGPAGYRRILTSQRRSQRSADGWVNVLPFTRAHYEAVFVAGGRPDLVGDSRQRSGRSRIEHAESLYRDVASVLDTKTTSEWLALFHEHGIPSTAVATVDDLVAELPVEQHPVVGAYRVIPPPVRFSATPSSVRRAAPLIGEHGAEILAEVGYSAEEIAALTDAGVLLAGPA